VGISEFAGRIGKVINHEIERYVKVISETRKGYNQKSVQYNPSGEDSPPVINDQLAILKIDGTGKYIVIGILNESQKAKPGEKILFARDQKGNIVLKIKMLNSGDYSFDNYTETTGEATGNYSKKIKGNYKKEVFKNSEEKIHENKEQTIKGNCVLNVEGDYTIKVTGKLWIQSKTDIGLKAPHIGHCDNGTVYK
jgi:hypothetical protein